MRKILLLCSLFAGITLACDNATVSYYSWANLKVFPEKVSNPIDEKEAKLRESNGEAYYILLTCDSGEVLQLVKRLNKKVFFQIDYLGTQGKITTDQNGKVTTYMVEKDL